MDPGTGLAILGGAAGSAKLLERMLGPTADYIGDGLKDWTERRLKNVGSIFQSAIEKAGDKLNQDGGVPPKVLKGVLVEGQFCDDLLSQEYFGGILASSRSGVSRDDRGATIIALLSHLSTYQIRAHYIFYFLVKQLFNGRDLTLTLPLSRSLAEIYIPESSFSSSMAFSDDEMPQFSQILSHIMFGLKKEDLIEPFLHFGSAEYLKTYFSEATHQGLIFQPTVLGVELSLWAYGRGDLNVGEFLNTNNEFPLVSGVEIGEGFQMTKMKKAE